jgi:predicted metal-dependent peptidase
MATRLQIKECDDWCPTAATDGRHLYYNTEFFHKLSTKEIEFVIGHEILHCVFNHLQRNENRNRMLYNIAADYLVNNTLCRDNIGEKPKGIQIFQDYKYDGWSSEEVYDDLFKNAKKIDISKLGKLLDEHIDWEKGPNGSSGGKDKNGKNKQPIISKKEMEKIQNEIKEGIMQSAQAAGPDHLPEEIERMIKDFANPKMDWREILQQQIQSVIRNDYTFARPSRKAWHSGIILPATDYEKTIDICVAIDTSGSIEERQLKTFLSEIQSIMDQYKDYNIKIWSFDTKVYNEQDFTASDGNLEDYDAKGGGGTDFMANWRYMKDNDIVPKKLIVFTDGYPWDDWGDPDYCDTIWVLHEHQNKNFEAPFGITTHYE